MSNDNFVQIIGNVTRDPELRFTPTGVAVCSFGIAWTPRRKTDNGWEDGESSFFNCSAWRDLGENIAASIAKGNRVVVSGSVRSRDWDDRDGNKRYAFEIVADEMEMLGGGEPQESRPSQAPQKPEEKPFNPDDDIPF